MCSVSVSNEVTLPETNDIHEGRHVDESTTVSIPEIQNIHEECHAGTCYFVNANFPNSKVSINDVKTVINQCKPCMNIDPKPQRWQHGHLDVVENWSRLAVDTTHFEGDIYKTIIGCGPSRFAIWRRIRNEDTTSVISQFDHIFLERGPPNELLLDNASVFRSEQFQTFIASWKVKLIYRCAHRPSGNGIVERNHRSIKRMAARSKKSVLQMVRYYNLAPSQGTNKPPYTLMYSYQWRYPLRCKEDGVAIIRLVIKCS